MVVARTCTAVFEAVAPPGCDPEAQAVLSLLESDLLDILVAVEEERLAEADVRFKGGASCVAEVPSVVVPEEANLLINPRHPDARRIRARKLRRWLYDPRTLR